MNKTIRRILTFCVALFISISQFGLYTVSADAVYATGSDGSKYYSINDAWNAAINGVKITMQADWYLSSSLHVPSGTKNIVTVDMNGKKIYRNQNSKRNEGYVLFVESNSSLKLTSSAEKKNF